MLTKISYRIGRKIVSLSLNIEGNIDVWVDNFSDWIFHIDKPLDLSDVRAGITWAVQDAAKRAPTTIEMAEMVQDVKRFFVQATNERHDESVRRTQEKQP